MLSSYSVYLGNEIIRIHKEMNKHQYCLLCKITMNKCLMRKTLKADTHVIFLTSVRVVVIVISLLPGKYFITKRVVASAQLISLYFILIAKRIYHDSHIELILNVNLE